MNAREKLALLAEKIAEADAVVIGGGSGLSSAAGYDHYHWSPALAEALAPFREHYGFTSPLAGFYHCYSSYGEQWGYYSQYMRFMWEAPTGQPYKDLATIVREKPCFVLTTNVDQQFFRVFPEEKVCAFQGDFSYVQCSQPCHDAIWESHSLVETLSTHLEGVQWKENLARYHDFLRHWLLEKSGKRIVLLELGVGEMTPSIIKLPFWQLAAKNDNVFYACLNKNQTQAPLHLADRALTVNADLAESLAVLRRLYT